MEEVVDWVEETLRVSEAEKALEEVVSAEETLRVSEAEQALEEVVSAEELGTMSTRLLVEVANMEESAISRKMVEVMKVVVGTAIT